MAENKGDGAWISYPEFEGSTALRWAGCRIFSLRAPVSPVRPIILVMREDAILTASRDVDPPYQVASSRPATNYSLRPGELTSALSPLRRADANLAAIELLKSLESERRPATEDEQRVLVQYAGWGGLPNAFRRPDGSIADGWSDIVRRLQSLLTHEEFTQARHSTLDAFFTPENVVRALWRGLVASGFQGGRMLETSCGTGNFIGTAPDGTQVDAIEADAITSSIARQCYPDHRIMPSRLESTPLRDNHYVLTIGNPPFGQQRLSGSAPLTELMRSAYNTHSYFVARAVEATQEGGVIAQVVSRYLMDSAAPDAVRFREALSARCDLITAIRLPGEAFKENAGTDVVTDILVFQKRPSDMAASPHRWTESRAWPLTYSSAGVETAFDAPVNEWFHHNSHHVLGEITGVAGRFGDGDMMIRPAPDWPERMESLLLRMPKDLFSSATETADDRADEAIHLSPDVARDKAPGDLFLMPADDGVRILRMDTPYMGVRRAFPVPSDYFGSATGIDKAIRLLTLHSTLLAVIEGQTDERNDVATLEADRTRLRAQYDAFVDKYGYIRSASNAKALRGDMAYATLRGLETSYDKGVSAAVAAKSGTVARAASATPSAILTTRTQYPVQSVQVASDAMSAFSLCLSQYGKLDAAWMARALNREDEWGEIREEIGDRMLYDFHARQWEPSSIALSGDVVTKLERLDRLIASPPSSVDSDFFHREALRLRAGLLSVQPERIRISDISPNPGAPWIPPEVVAEFIHKIIGRDTGPTRYNEFLSKWELPNESTYYSGNAVWGGTVVSAVRLLNALLNQVPIVITDRVYPDKTVVNVDKTALANDYLTKLVEEWDTWITADAHRCLAIESVYNERFNRHVAPHYDGSHLTLHGSSDEITMRPTQKNFVWRTCLSRGVLADHAVGAGKTYAAVASVMENLRLNLIKKAMIVVPNHLVDQWESAYRVLYPTAKLLVSTPESMSATNRPAFLAQIAMSSIDACIMPHSSFSLIAGDPDFIASYIETQIDDLDAELIAMAEAGQSPSKQTTKQMERAKKALYERLNKRLTKAASERASIDRGLNFGDLGIDMLVVDESHLFKNVPFQTDMKNVKGLGNPMGSRRAEDMMMKVHFLQQRNGRVLFLSGTPISNSLAEFYLLQRYFQSEQLKKLGIRSFDAWAATFARVSHGFQFTLAGQFKEQSYLNQFNSLNVLRDMASQFSDVVTTKDVSRLMEEAGMGVLRLPPLNGGKTNIVVSQMTPMQRKIFGVETADSTAERPAYETGSILHRLDNLPKGRPEKGDDNILVIISDMKKTALDARTINPLLPMEDQGKIADCIGHLQSVYHEFSSVRGTQIVFLDMSTPKSGDDAEVISLVALSESGDPDVAEAAAERLSAYTALEIDTILSRADKHSFSAYVDIRQRLIALGIPEHEIAFAHDFDTPDKKQRMQQDMNAGRIRILLGSTSKLGAGSNVQERLVAVHHLDIPYRPSDIEQRNGRILRQGNVLLDLIPDFSVYIFQYVTEGSGDAGAAQIIENKQIMLNILRDNSLGNTLDDAEQSALDPAAIKAMASGNELLVEEVELSAYIKKASRLQRSISQDNANIQYGRERAMERLTRSTSRVAHLSRLMSSVDGFRDRIAAHEKAVVARHCLTYENGELVIPKPSGESGDVPRLTKKKLESDLALVPLFRRDEKAVPTDMPGDEFNDHVGRTIAAGIRANQYDLMVWRDVPLTVGFIGDFSLSVTISRSDRSDRDMMMVIAIKAGDISIATHRQSYHESVQWDRRFTSLIAALPEEMDRARTHVRQDERDLESYANSPQKEFGREAELAEARCRHEDIVAALRAGCRTHAQWEAVRHEKIMSASVN